ncbi:hypothetical protein Pst134EA_009761 [Puccinia striiformis f. sp. tritici]|uniref:hypothetical protein n=1 Tax=Puccinia striiformis f. sp. tritici TaxID=168172 RepID=UPI002008A1A5|nr:hypothetical protein Pst134EA_009761 [Puccinia striiformis f. sp. tritici]KAH9469239.1 hypothetical protein Pst134EA_009761 [Puccinia striiformis f. sp. tritici]
MTVSDSIFELRWWLDVTSRAPAAFYSEAALEFVLDYKGSPPETEKFRLASGSPNHERTLEPRRVWHYYSPARQSAVYDRGDASVWANHRVAAGLFIRNTSRCEVNPCPSDDIFVTNPGPAPVKN